MSAPVLDVRPVPASLPDVGGRLLVDDPKASGTAHGYLVEAQRKSPHLRPAVCIRLTASRFAEGDLHVSTVAMLIRYGFSRTAAKQWFGEFYKVGSESEVKALAAFRAKGWNPQQVDAVRQVERARSRQTGARDATVRVSTWAWSAMTWDEAWLAMRAGMSAQTARRLLRDEEWNEQALVTIGGLRHADPNRAGLLDLAR